MNSIIQNSITSSLPQLLQKLAPSQLAVLVDDNTSQFCYPIIKDLLPSHTLIPIPAGEHYKNLQSCQHIWEELTTAGLDRKAVLINLGGGVITDMGGFCAATYKRGIRFVNIPTTLLAQVDASVGSKTGVDFGNLKNHIGLFAEAEAVLIDTQFLTTLPHRELRSGYAEVVKHALIADEQYWKSIQQKPWDSLNWDEIVEQSINIKSDVVQQDPTEKGLRKILNFGHSIGHALESTCLNTENHLLHGEAIAIGMLCESFIAYKKGLIEETTLSIIEEYIERVWPIISVDEDIIQSSMNLLGQDKKNEEGTLLFSLISSIGTCEYNVAVDQEEALESIKWYQQKSQL